MAEVSPQNNWYVYRHFKADDPTECFYVGIGHRKQRHCEHYGRNSFWHNVVKLHGFISEVVASRLDQESAMDLEKLLITEYGRRNIGSGPLVNLTDGGEGNVGWNPSESTRTKMRSNRIGTTMPEATKIKIGLKHKGRIISDKTRKMISESLMGHSVSEKTINSLRARASKIINKYTIAGVFVESFVGFRSAAESVNGSIRPIHHCVYDGQLSYKGFIWKSDPK